MTRWTAVARKEVHGLFAGRILRIGLWLVILVFVLGGYIVPTTVQNPSATSVTFADYEQLLRGTVVILVPLVGLLLGYRTVVGERAGGQLALILSLPHSRAEVVFGKALARGSVLTATITAGTVAAAALVEYPFGTVSLTTFAIVLVTTVVYGLVFLAIGLAISTVTASTRRATVFTFGIFFLFVVAWPQLDGYFLTGLQYVGLAGNSLPEWAQFVYGAEPSLLYQRVMDAFVAKRDTGAYLGPAAPWYLGGGVAALLLIAWTILPALGGYIKFQRTEL